jgi:cleavage stimulation factor subunit 2
MIIQSVMNKFNQPVAPQQPPSMPIPVPSLPPAPLPVPTPTMPLAVPQPQFPPNIGASEKQLILQILQMNPQDIEKLPPQQKQQVVAIRAQFLPPGSM